MRVHVGDQLTIDTDATNGVWVPLDAMSRGLDVAVKDLDGGRIGLCPRPDECVMVPRTAVAGEADDRQIQVDVVAEALGLAFVRDSHHAVLVPGASAPPRLDVGQRVDLELTDLGTGRPAPLVTGGRPAGRRLRVGLLVTLPSSAARVAATPERVR